MWCTRVVYMVVICLASFPVFHCNYTCGIFENQVIHVPRDTDVLNLNFAMPKRCYPNNHTRPFSVEISSAIGNSKRFKANCQIFHDEEGLCLPSRLQQICSCDREEKLYSIPISVKDVRRQQWQVTCSFTKTSETVHDIVTILRKDSTWEIPSIHVNSGITETSPSPVEKNPVIQNIPTPAETSTRKTLSTNLPRGRTPEPGRTRTPGRTPALNGIISPSPPPEEAGDKPDEGIPLTIIVITAGVTVVVFAIIIIVVVVIRKRRNANERDKVMSLEVDDMARSDGQHQQQEQAASSDPPLNSADDDDPNYQRLADYYVRTYTETTSDHSYLAPTGPARLEVPQEDHVLRRIDETTRGKDVSPGSSYDEVGLVQLY